MSDLLRELWSRAECEEPVFSAEEIEWAPPGQFELLGSLGLLKETDRATWAHCEACGDGHVEEIVWVQNATTGRPTPFVPCPENGGVSISIERLRRWAIDLDAIAQAVRGALDLIGNDSVLLPGRVWFLGRRHVAGRFRDFFFVVGAARDDAHTLGNRCRQVEDAPSPVILVPSQTPSERKAPAFRLADLAAITDGQVVVDLDYLADALPREGNATTAKTMSSFPVPADATWAELSLVVREHTLVARLRNQEQEFTFEDVGLSGTNDRLWQLLCALARLGGETPHRSQSGSAKDATTFRKQVSDLRQRLSTVFPIDGEPIRAVHGTGSYRCLFQISLDRADGFPVQPERWDECRFTELPDGRIAISVRTKEVFAARTISGETARRTDMEAAERTGVRTEEYDLRALGLADQIGRPTGEGRVLLEFLRNRGKLQRRGDDKYLLRLANRLSAWMGIHSSPFQFTFSRTLWSTLFESSSHHSGATTA
ncbi:MAG: hypothetical protein LC130_13810 [Bryobacterales bacterium]|nr:hypothetical protein [Bryobacterales bacterium]MEB2364376.1 hypothetical protein [Bryobacterales bacterium]